MDIQGPLFGSLILIVIILMSLSVHEFAHAFVADLYGDPTAKNLGRLSINPARHWDPIGTTLLVGLIFLSSFVRVPVFGWGKPVPVDERNFENPRLHGLQVALAGPMSNLLLAFVFAGFLRIGGLPGWLTSIFELTIYLNLFLMFFNLLPIPPLDGSRVLRLFLSDQAYYNLATNPIFSFGLIFVAIYFLLDYVSLATQYLSALLIR